MLKSTAFCKRRSSGRASLSPVVSEEITYLANDEAYYNEIAERCYKRALEFDISKMVVGYELVYRNVIENH